MTAAPVHHDASVAIDDEIDLRDLLRQLWQGKKTIVLSACIASVLAVCFGYVTTAYVSEGILQTSVFESIKVKDKDKDKDKIGINAYNYRKYADVLSNQFNFIAYLDKANDLSPQVVSLLKSKARTDDELKSIFAPVFVVSEKDQKQWGIKLDPVEAGQLQGLRIFVSAREKNNGQAIKFLEGYARDTIARVVFSDYLPKMCQRYQQKKLALEVEIGSLGFDLREEQNRVNLLKPLVKLREKEISEHNRQVISIDGESKYFLSARVHLSAAEVKAAGIQMDIQRNRMLIQESSALAQAYCTAEVELADWGGVDAFLKKLEKIGGQVASIESIDRDLIVRVSNVISLDVETFRVGFLQSMRFLQSSEQLESRVRKMHFGVLGILGCLIGFFIGSAFVLIRVWWCSSASIKSESKTGANK